MKRTIYILETALEEPFEVSQLQMALNLMGTEEPGFPMYWEENNSQYFGYLPDSLADYEDVVKNKMYDIIYHDGYRADNTYELHESVTLHIIEAGKYGNCVVCGPDLVAIQTPEGMLKAQKISTSFDSENQPMGIEVFLENGHKSNKVASIHWDDETGLVMRAWCALSVNENTDPSVAYCYSEFPDVDRNAETQSMGDYSEYVTAEIPVGLLVAIPYKDETDNTCGIDIRISGFGGHISTLWVEYRENEPFCGDTAGSMFGEDVPPQRKYDVSQETVVLPGIITRYWEDLKNMDAPAYRLFHF